MFPLFKDVKQFLSVCVRVLVQYVARLVYSNPLTLIDVYRGEVLYCLPRGFCWFYRGGLRKVDALFVTYILLTIYVTEVNDIGKCVEMNLFI